MGSSFYLYIKGGSGAKIVGYEKKQKIPSGMELYAVKPKSSLIRYICLWTDFSPWRGTATIPSFWGHLIK
ncbi:hypothetical protein CN271_28835 [Bacillus cereus]|nr:hypothetical protein CON59_19380 [Bacillus cereus]PET38990.1 hypothetical protein CN523_25660 [Bacillus cereus]PFA53775.1 hypothetical protein CN389_19875 [Bacillus cereus]PFD61194.1 hypothetical protein CN271_28835 [Bacillus cereus]PFE69338.1 hypothetical protein CN319_22830 [Bacillus cereus]